MRLLRQQQQAMRQARRQLVAQRPMRQARSQLVAQRPAITRRAGPVSGLANLGNTCYLNSVLQCLRHSRPLKVYLLGKGFAQDNLCLINRQPIQQAFLAEFKALIQKLEEDNKVSQRPTAVHQRLGMVNGAFRGFRQEDAQECLNTILQTLHAALQLNVRITIDEGRGNSRANHNLRKGLRQYEAHLKHGGYSAIDEIFGSQFESRLSCQRCGHVWSTFDPYSLVPVEIPNQAVTIYDCLDQFMLSEELENVICERCSEQHGKTNVDKQFRLWTLPKMLVIQLKRFNGSGRGLRKIEKFIQAPLKLNISKYVSHPRVLNQIQRNPAALQLYDLKGVVCHSGQLNGGHYTAKCYRDDEPRGWFTLDDNYTQRINDVNDIQSNLNYIFFYEMSPETRRWWRK